MKRDLYKDLKGQRNEISTSDFKESLFDLVENMLKNEQHLTPEQGAELARLRAYIEIRFNDW